MAKEKVLTLEWGAGRRIMSQVLGDWRERERQGWSLVL